MDVVNLETNTFETVTVTELLDEHRRRVPGLTQVFSVLEDGRLEPPGERFLVDAPEQATWWPASTGCVGDCTFVEPDP